MKEWFILVGQKEKGPFSIQELRYHPQVNPDTLVRKFGWTSWKKMKEIPELQEIFEDSEELEEKKVPPFGAKEELSITQSIEPGHFLFWITIVLLVALYLYVMFKKING